MSNLLTRSFICILSLVALAGCATQPKEEVSDTVVFRGQAPNVQIVPVHFATDREPAQPSRSAPWFLGERGDGRLRYGIVEVSIPASHKPGELESPAWWRLEFSADPNKHVIAKAMRPQDQRVFWRDVLARQKGSDSRQTILFVHGYNVSFENAARRTAQFAYDLGFEGTPIFYSWPSKAALTGYKDDEKAVEWSMPHLKGFLEEIAKNSPQDEEIIIIAHSMGNRPTSHALAELFVQQPMLRGRFKEVILMAPDIDATIFRNQIAPVLISQLNRVTLYASSNDIALKASDSLHGGQRLGETAPAIITLPGMESIDASAVPTDLLGHSYYGNAVTVLNDLKALMNGRRLASERKSTLVEKANTSGRYWLFPTVVETHK